MDKEQLHQLKSLLQAEKQRIQFRQVKNKQYGLDVELSDSIGELSVYDNHPADIGTEMFEREKDMVLQSMTDHHMRDVEDALVRMEKGEYGFCAVCGKEIPFERLEIVPETNYCVQHQPEPGTVHETNREHPVLSWDDEGGENAWEDVEQYGTSTE